MKKLKLYVETTVWNFLLVDDSPGKRIATEKLFEEIEAGKYGIFISDIVLDEIKRAPWTRMQELESLIAEIRPELLKTDDNFKSMVEIYRNAKFIPERFGDDLFHIAIASVNEMDIIVSWNLQHIVKLKTKRVANSINIGEGYKSIDILTPEEVIDNV